MIELNSWKTAIVPVKKQGDTYSIVIHKSLWNTIQALMLDGGTQRKTTIEFKIEEEGNG